MASQLTICNLALGRLGADSILDLNGTQKEAQACRLFYQPSLDEVLRCHPWNFAIRRADLTADPVDPSFGWAKSYALPSDCLRVVDLNDLGALTDPPRWQIEGRSIYCDQDEAHIRYIARVDDPSQYDSLFVSALSCLLAANIAKKVTGSDSIAQAKLQEFEVVYGPNARFGDLKETRAKPKAPWVISDLVKSRRTYNLNSGHNYGDFVDG